MFLNRFQQLHFKINHYALEGSSGITGMDQILEKKIEQLKQRTVTSSHQVFVPGMAPQPNTLFRSRSAPPNDACENATAMTAGSYDGNTCGATIDGVASCVDYSSPDVWFKYTADASGSVTIDTQGSDVDTVLSVHTGCPGSVANEIACNDDCIGLDSCVTFDAVAGTTYLVRVSTFVDIDAGAFKLNLFPGTLPGGSISGTVRDAGNGAPLEGVNVALRDSTGNFLDSADTDSNGHYALIHVMPGSYFLATNSHDQSGYVDEVYDNIPCRDYECDWTGGTPISVQEGVTTGGIDFDLTRGATISGKVTDETDGSPVYSDVDVYNSDGNFANSGFTDDDGNYTVSGLSGGIYFAVTENGEDYADELYNNLPCANGCDPVTGTPIHITLSQVTGEINFALIPGGKIAGIVSDSKNQSPLASISVDVFDSDGYFVTFGRTDSAGKYVAGGLPTGTYFATAVTYEKHLDQLYRNIPCEEGCDVLTGEPIAVTAASTTENIDFALEVGGRITGKVTNAKTKKGIQYATILVFNAQGERVSFGSTDARGKYEVGSLPAGNYFVYAGDRNYVDEVYRGLVCPELHCNVLSGTPIPVKTGSRKKNINFKLDRGGSISGTVKDSSGNPLPYAEVEVLDSTGIVASYAYTNDSGTFRAAGLITGNYFAVTDNYDGYVNEIFDNIPCMGYCNPTSGTPISVTRGVNTPGINFQLDQGGNISGTITDADTGKPLSDISVDIFDSQGNQVGEGYDYSCGEWITNGGLAAGVYFARTFDSHGYLDELYNNIPCPDQNCNPTEGTPIAVSIGNTTSGIDFDLKLPPR